MVFGYGRVSLKDQNPNLQQDALERAGCDLIFIEKISGTKTSRPQLDQLLGQLRKGDTLVIWRLDRLGRSLIDLVRLMNDFRKKDVRFVCITMQIDTETAGGRLMYNIFASLAEYVRDLIVENTQAGLQASRDRGIKPGRPEGMSEEAKIMAVTVWTLNQVKTLTKRQIANQLNISTRTMYKYLDYQRVIEEAKLNNQEIKRTAVI